MAVILTAANNVSAVSRGLYTPNFTLNIRDLDTRNKTLYLESAQFELQFDNVSETANKLYVVSGNNHEDQVSIVTGSYSDTEDLVALINEALKRAGHRDIVLTYSRRTSRISVSIPDGKRCVLKGDSPSVVLGIGEIKTTYEIKRSQTFPHAVDLTQGRRLVLLYTDLIGPSIEYEDNTDSSVVKTFLVQTLNGVNNYVFGKEDERLMLPHENVREMTFWLKFNTGEHITSGYAIYLDLRVRQVISPTK